MCAVGKGEVEGEGEVGAGPVEAKPSQGFSPTPPLPTECLASAVNRNWVFRQIPRITKSQRPEIAGKAAAVTPHVAQIALSGVRCPSAHAGSH